MNIGSYIVAVEGKKRFILAGPYRTKNEAAKHSPKFRNANLSECPDKFITPMQYDYPDKIIMIIDKASRDELPVSWFGNAPDTLQQDNIF